MKVEIKYSDPPEEIQESYRIDLYDVNVYRNRHNQICIHLKSRTAKYFDYITSESTNSTIIADELLEWRCPVTGKRWSACGVHISTFSGEYNDHCEHVASILLIPETQEESDEFDSIMAVSYIPLKYEYICVLLDRKDFFKDE